MQLLYTFYGDDFTGSTDVLEQLGINGVPAVLFIGTPQRGTSRRILRVQAFGIAGDSRSRSPEWMSANISRQSFRGCRSSARRLFTTKSVPPLTVHRRSGASAARSKLACEVFSLRASSPSLSGHHIFVAMWHSGIFSPPTQTARFSDRPPSDEQHPVTPMHEADLRGHLAAQTQTQIGLIDLPTLQSGRSIEQLLPGRLGACVPSCSTRSTPNTQATVGKLLWGQRRNDASLLRRGVPASPLP